ncbi:uncharacterized protein VTP21DRAFT_4158 [Calcarisporiella thermophila]|uniref:uncharacterized protein n=1 Tax=Calcarisporiella thermophila TaxID=911321 RepID=UPI003743071F
MTRAMVYLRTNHLTLRLLPTYTYPSSPNARLSLLLRCRPQSFATSLPKFSYASFSTSRPPSPPESQGERRATQPQNEPIILEELLYGRTRIYTSLPPRPTSPTHSKTSPSIPLTSSRKKSSPLPWYWRKPEAAATATTTQAGDERNKKWFGGFGSMKQSLSAMFLPVGYPETVHECYKKFHLWQASETFVGSAVGVLCSQAMLASLGLGEEAATGGAVAIQWVLKDGFGEVGKLFFIKRFAFSFDSHPKTWKFVSEIFSLVGSFLQLCTSIAPTKYFLPLASLGNACESIHYSVWGASHMTFTRNFALAGNVGDVVAKTDAQTSLAHLVGMLSGVGLITISHDPSFLFACYAALAPLNLYSTVSLLNSANFEILNQAKLTLIARQYIDTETVPTMQELKDREIGFGEWIKPGKGAMDVRLQLGVMGTEAFGNVEEILRCIEVFKKENYLLNYHKNTFSVLFHADAESNDVIRAILHAVKFHDLLFRRPDAKVSPVQRALEDEEEMRRLLEESLQWTRKMYPQFVAELDQKDWQSDMVFWKDRGFRVQWARDEPQVTKD